MNNRALMLSFVIVLMTISLAFSSKETENIPSNTKSRSPSDSTKLYPEMMQMIWHDRNPYIGFPKTLYESDLKGWDNQHPYLIEAVDELRPSLIVDVGVWKGGSTLVMASRLKELGLDAVVIASDTWLGNEEYWSNDELFEQLEIYQGFPRVSRKFITNVVRMGLEDYVIPLPLDSLNVGSFLRNKNVRLDIVHINWSNDYRTVKANLLVWWPLIKEGGILIGNDSITDRSSSMEIRKAFEDYFRELGMPPIECTNGKCRIMKRKVEAILKN